MFPSIYFIHWWSNNTSWSTQCQRNGLQNSWKVLQLYRPACLVCRGVCTKCAVLSILGQVIHERRIFCVWMSLIKNRWVPPTPWCFNFRSVSSTFPCDPRQSIFNFLRHFITLQSLQCQIFGQFQKPSYTRESGWVIIEIISLPSFLVTLNETRFDREMLLRRAIFSPSIPFAAADTPFSLFKMSRKGATRRKR